MRIPFVYDNEQSYDREEMYAMIHESTAKFHENNICKYFVAYITRRNIRFN